MWLLKIICLFHKIKDKYVSIHYNTGITGLLPSPNFFLHLQLLCFFKANVFSPTAVHTELLNFELKSTKSKYTNSTTEICNDNWRGPEKMNLKCWSARVSKLLPTTVFIIEQASSSSEDGPVKSQTGEICDHLMLQVCNWKKVWQGRCDGGLGVKQISNCETAHGKILHVAVILYCFIFISGLTH